MFVRPEQPGDHAVIHAVHARAFAGPGGDEPAEARLVDQLRRAADLVPALCLVAEVDGAVVGHVAVSRGSLEGVLGIAPLAVLPEHHGRGVGSALMHSVVAAAEALWYRALILLGDPQFYGRFGFEPASTQGVVSTHPQWPGDAFMLRTLPSSWPGPYPGGTVFRYAAAIEAL